MPLVRSALRFFLRVWPWRGGQYLPFGMPSNVWPGEKKRRLLHVPSDAELAQNWAVRRLAAQYKGLGISRHKIADWVADMVYGFNGEFVGEDGQVLDLPEVDDVFGDPSFKWIGDFLKWSDRAPRQAIQTKVIPRIRLMKMAMAVADAGELPRMQVHREVKSAMWAAERESKALQDAGIA